MAADQASIEAATRRIAELETQLLDQRLQLDLAVRAARIGLFRWNSRSDELWASAELPVLFGLKPGSIVCGADLLSHVHPEDIDHVAEALRQSRETGSEYQAEFRIVQPSGRTRWLAGSGKWTFAAEDRAGILTGANWDISATRLQSERVRRILDGIAVAAFLLDPPGGIREVNAATLELTGLEPHHFAGKDLWTAPWWTDDTLKRERLRQAVERARDGISDRFDTKIVNASNQLVDVEVRVSPLRNEDEEITHLLASAYEITARKKTEEQVKLVNRELMHRIANVFTVITSLLRLSTPYSTTVEEFVDTTIQRLRALEMAHRDVAADDPERPSELNDLARRVLAPWLEAASRRCNISGELLRLSRGEATAFSLIFLELATNAAKHGSLSTPEGRIDLSWQQEELRFRVNWRERGGPEAVAPSRRGFGVTVIETLSRDYLGGEARFDFSPQGLSVEVVARR